MVLLFVTANHLLLIFFKNARFTSLTQCGQNWLLITLYRLEKDSLHPWTSCQGLQLLYISNFMFSSLTHIFKKSCREREEEKKGALKIKLQTLESCSATFSGPRHIYIYIHQCTDAKFRRWTNKRILQTSSYGSIMLYTHSAYPAGVCIWNTIDILTFGTAVPQF